MPTVMLTTTCPNECPWCFARPKMDAYTAKGVTEMSWDDFLQVVDFYERSGMRQMNLLGGEPTRHSRLIDILAFLESKQFSVQITTNGIMPPSLVDVLKERRLARPRATSLKRRVLMILRPQLLCFNRVGGTEVQLAIGRWVIAKRPAGDTCWQIRHRHRLLVDEKLLLDWLN